MNASTDAGLTSASASEYRYSWGQVGASVAQAWCTWRGPDQGAPHTTAREWACGQERSGCRARMHRAPWRPPAAHVRVSGPWAAAGALLHSCHMRAHGSGRLQPCIGPLLPPPPLPHLQQPLLHERQLQVQVDGRACRSHQPGQALLDPLRRLPQQRRDDGAGRHVCRHAGGTGVQDDAAQASQHLVRLPAVPHVCQCLDQPANEDEATAAAGAGARRQAGLWVRGSAHPRAPSQCRCRRAAGQVCGCVLPGAGMATGTGGHAHRSRQGRRRACPAAAAAAGKGRAGRPAVMQPQGARDAHLNRCTRMGASSCSAAAASSCWAKRCVTRSP